MYLNLACWQRDDVCGGSLRGDGTNEEASEHGYFAIVGLEEFEHRAGLCQGGRRWVEAELDRQVVGETVDRCGCDDRTGGRGGG